MALRHEKAEEPDLWRLVGGSLKTERNERNELGGIVTFHGEDAILVCRLGFSRMFLRVQMVCFLEADFRR